MYVCVYIYIYTSTYICIYIYIYLNVCVYVRMYEWVCERTLQTNIYVISL